MSKDDTQNTNSDLAARKKGAQDSESATQLRNSDSSNNLNPGHANAAASGVAAAASGMSLFFAFDKGVAQETASNQIENSVATDNGRQDNAPEAQAMQNEAAAADADPIAPVNTSLQSAPSKSFEQTPVKDADGTTYTIDDARFTIAPDGAVRVAPGANFDAETQSAIEVAVTATTEDGTTTVTNYPVELEDINAHDISATTDSDAGANAVSESAANGTTVGVTASASDADATNNTITYSVVDASGDPVVGGPFAVDANTGVVTVADNTQLDYEGDATPTVYIKATSADGSSSQEGFTINLSDADEADVGAISDTNAGANTVAENVAVGTTVGITASASDADGTDSVTYSLSDDAGGLFTIDANTGVVTVAGAIDRETAASYDIEVTATSSDTSTSTQTYTINVSDIDEFDVGAVTDSDRGANTLTETASAGTAVGVVASATDADASSNTITYSVDDARFTVDADGTVRVASGASFDYETEASIDIEVTATSADGSSSNETFTLDVSDINESAVSAISDADGTSNTVAENVVVGTTVGITTAASDADGDDSVTYSLSDDAGGLFTIDANTGVVTVAGAIDRETAASYDIEVTATSSDTSTSTQTYTINVSDIDEFDVTTPADSDAGANTVSESAANGTTVGVTASASDADATTDGVTYSIVDINGDPVMVSPFAVDANTGVVTVANNTLLDYEGDATPTVYIKATSEDGSTSQESFTINLTDADEADVGAISDTNAGANTVAENVALGTTVGITASASDADGTDSVTYSLSDDAGGLFTIDANTGVVTVAGSIDRETAASYDIEVTATSSDTSTSTQTYTINVSDIDEFDTSATTDSDGTSNAVSESAANGTAVGVMASASDADATNNTITYSVVDASGDPAVGGPFAVDANTGVVTVADNTQLDYEGDATPTVYIKATSADGSSTQDGFTINLTDINEGPTDITFTGGTVNETVVDGGDIDSAYDPSGTTVATLGATDVDEGDTFTYVITSDPSGHYEIVGNEVRVKAGQTIDFETAISHDVTIEVTDTGGNTYSETITINVADYEGAYTGDGSDNSVTGTSEEDSISTGDGADTISGSVGADIIDGGDGIDTVDYSASSEGVTVDIRSGGNSGGDAEGDVLTSIENVIATDFVDSVFGSDDGTVAYMGDGGDEFDNANSATGVDVVYGEGGDDVIYTGDGDDRIIGGAGDDHIRGEDGNDTAVFSGNWSDYTIVDRGWAFQITDNRPDSPDGTDFVYSVENYEFADGTVGAADLLNVGPTDIDLSSTAIDENSAAGTVVATLTTTDANAGDSFTYVLTADASNNFEIVGNEVRVKAGATIDAENTATHDITIEVTDSGGSTYSETITINVSDIDEFDVGSVTDSDRGANTLTETASAGTAVGVVASASDADATTNTITYSVDDARFTVDADGTVRVASGASFDYETEASIDIEVTATSADGSSSNETFTLDVTDINESAVSAISDTNAGANTVAENVAVGTTVGITASASDADGDDSVTYSLSDDAGGLFTIDANTGVVTVAGAIDRETAASYDIEVTATSSDTSTSTQTYTINVSDIDEFDVGSVTDSDAGVNTLTETASAGTAVGVVASASDADATTNTITYSVDDARFTVDADGTVRVASGASFDYETEASIDIEVTATSADGSSSNETFTLDVTDINESAVSAISDTNAGANTVAENVAVGTTVGITASASDADGDDSVTYSLSDDAGGLFTIDANTGVVTVAGAIDRETAASYDIEVTATSSDTSTSTQTYTINVSDIDEFDVGAVTDVASVANEMDEGAAAANQFTGVQANATDADSTDTVSYTVDDGRFVVASNGAVYAVRGTVFDAETEASIDVVITATSSDGSTSTESFTINVNDIDEVDVGAVSDSNRGSNTVAENSSVGTEVGITASASDTDVDDTVTYSLSDDAGGLFTIDANTGVVTVAGAIDRETAASYDIEVTATSSDTSTSTQSYTINVSDIDEFDTSATTDSDAGANAVSESAANGTTVGVTASAFDADATNNTITYSVVDASGDPVVGGPFAVDASTGVVTVADNTQLDYEGDATPTVYIKATSADGSSTQEGFTINLTDEFDEAATDADYTSEDGNLLVNGSFESGSTGWSNANDFVETNSTGTFLVSGADGSSVAELDVANNEDTLYQDVQTVSGQTYELSLDVAQRGNFGIAADSNTVEVYWNGTLVDTIDPETTNLETYTFAVTGTGGNDRLEFREPSGDNNRGGGIIDNVSLVSVVQEGAANGTLAATMTGVTDADAGDSHTFSLVDDAGGAFTIDTNSGAITVADGSAIDYETAQSMDVTVRVTDAGGNTYDEVVSIKISDKVFEEAATDIVFNGNENLATSNPTGGSAVVTGEIDASGGNTSIDHWSITHNGGDLDIDVLAFGFNGSTLDSHVRLATHDGSGNLTILYSSDDGIAGGDGSTSSTDSYLSMSDLPAGDYVLLIGQTNVGEAEAEQTANSHPNTTDAGSGAYQISFSGDTIVNGMEDNPGNPGNDWGDPLSNAVIVDDGAGAEIIASGSIVADVSSVIDSEASDSHTFAFTDDAAGKFAIDSDTGEITLVADHDISSAYSDTVTVEVTDAGGNTYSETIKINFGTAGGETLNSTSNTSDITYGFGGNDTLLGGSGDDYLYGGEGDDSFNLGGGNDHADGGEGTDTLTVVNGSDNNVDLSAGTYTVNSNSNTNTMTDIENVDMTGSNGTNSIIGDEEENVLTGGSGNDTISGGLGDDTLEGGDGNDILDGGDGTSFESLVTDNNPVGYWRLSDSGSTATDDSGNGRDGTYESGAASGASGALMGESDTAASFDGVDDYVEIPASTDYQIADGSVTLWFNTDALGGTQTLLSRDSTDFDAGGHLMINVDASGQLDVRHQDTSSNYNIDSGTDTVAAGEWHMMTYSWGADGMRLYLDGELVGSDAQVTTLEGNNEPWTIGASQNASGDGVADNLQKFFSGQIDEVAVFDGDLDVSAIQDMYEAGSAGLNGNDTINGGDGNDTLIGGTGADAMDGGTGTDTVDYSGASEGVTVAFQDVDNTDGLGGNYQGESAGGLGGEAEGDTFTSIEAFTGSDHDDEVYGGNSDMSFSLGDGDDVFDTEDSDVVADTIDAGAGNDSIWAGAGDDRITGGAGDDWMEGEAGSDIFTFAAGDGTDTVEGGVAGGWTDVIELAGMDGAVVIDGQTVTGQGWTMELDVGSSVSSQNGESLTLSDDAAGTITLDDGAIMNFTDIEEVTW